MSVKQLSVFAENKNGSLFAITEILVNVTDVVGAQIPDCKGGLSQLLGVINKADVAVEYLYAFTSTEEGKAFVVFRVENNEEVEKLLRDNGINVL